MSSEAYKYWATNRGWISTKFSVKNPITHFLNLYKKKQPQSKPQRSQDERNKYFTAQKRKIPTHYTEKVAKSQQKISIEPQQSKPQTAPHNYTINSSIFLGEQIQKKSKTIQHPNRNRPLHKKKAKKVEEQFKGLGEINTVITRIKEEKQISEYSQKNFKVTDCGRYKRQMIFLQPQIRASTASFNHNSSKKVNSSMKAHEQFQRRKTTIYKQINKSMDVDMKIREMQQFQRSTSASHYQPIEYMTEYGYQRNKQVRQGNVSALIKEQKGGYNFRRKPNLSVLRNKLSLHYKKSDYKKKIESVKQTETQDYSFDPFD